MRTLIVMAASVLLLSAALAQERPVTGSIEGLVASVKTGEPVAGARVTLGSAAALPARGAAPASPARVAVTDGQGRFALRNVDPGVYSLTIQSNGYVRQEFGQKVFPGQGTPVQVTAGSTLKDLVVRLTPTGNVSGRILDRAGLPAVDAPVQLTQFTYDANGQRTSVVSSFVRTDDRGEYRLYYVTPGRYYIGAGNLPGPPQSGAGVINTTGSPNEGTQVYSHAFYPGGSDVEQASAVDIQPGAELTGIDIRLDRRRFYRIRGRLIDSRTGQPPANASFSLNYPPSSNLSMGSSGFSYDPATGAFDLNRIVAGPYRVVAQIRDAGAGATAVALVHVVDSDIEGLLLTTASFSIAGRLSTESMERMERQASIPPSLMVELRTIAGSVTGRGISQADGAFTLTGVLNGQYRVAIGGGTPTGLYIKSARFGDADVLNQPLTLDGPSATLLEIVLSPRPGQIAGRLAGAQGQSAVANQAVLVPDQNRNRAELFRTAPVDPSGRFTIADVVPGDYRIFAWEALAPYAYFDPDTLKRYEPQGKPVHVEESSRVDVSVQIIPAAEP